MGGKGETFKVVEYEVYQVLWWFSSVIVDGMYHKIVIIQSLLYLQKWIVDFKIDEMIIIFCKTEQIHKVVEDTQLKKGKKATS